VFSGTLLAKRLQVARELVPADALLAALMNPAGHDSDIKDLQDAARIIGQRLAIVNASADNELASAFESAVRQQAKMLLVGSDVFFNNRRDQIVASTRRTSIGCFRYTDTRSLSTCSQRSRRTSSPLCVPRPWPAPGIKSPAQAAIAFSYWHYVAAYPPGGTNHPSVVQKMLVVVQKNLSQYQRPS
jgi:hypothetical protein